jgi:hypothetical protein
MTFEQVPPPKKRPVLKRIQSLPNFELDFEGKLPSKRPQRDDDQEKAKAYGILHFF